MSAAAKYTAALLAAIPPELARRIEITTERERKTPSDVMIDFLTRGANTPQFLGVGANTCNAPRAKEVQE